MIKLVVRRRGRVETVEDGLWPVADQGEGSSSASAARHQIAADGGGRGGRHARIHLVNGRKSGPRRHHTTNNTRLRDYYMTAITTLI